MKKGMFVVTLAVAMAAVCTAQSARQLLSFDVLFPPTVQRSMGLQKLTANEKEALRAHVERLILTLAMSRQVGSSGVYGSVRTRHWIRTNVDSGKYILLEDGSLWQIHSMDRLRTMLWLPVSDITVTRSSSGPPGFDYLLIKTDNGQAVHAKYIGDP